MGLFFTKMIDEFKIFSLQRMEKKNLRSFISISIYVIYKVFSFLTIALKYKNLMKNSNNFDCTLAKYWIWHFLAIKFEKKSSFEIRQRECFNRKYGHWFVRTEVAIHMTGRTSTNMLKKFPMFAFLVFTKNHGSLFLIMDLKALQCKISLFFSFFITVKPTDFGNQNWV